MRKVGLLFGSFDPFHNGHLNIVTNVFNKKIVDDIYIVVAAHNPWKSQQTDYKDRMEMCSITIEQCKPYLLGNIYVDNTEQIISNKKEGTDVVYTYETLHQIKQVNPSIDFYIIVTQETYLDIPKWEHGEEILNENKFIILLSKHLGEKQINCSTRDVIITIENDIDICSTNIRNKIKNKENFIPFVQTNVAEYIKNKGLYI